MIEIIRGPEKLQCNPGFIREAIACMKKRKRDVCGEDHKYFDAAIAALMEVGGMNNAGM